MWTETGAKKINGWLKNERIYLVWDFFFFSKTTQNRFEFSIAQYTHIYIPELAKAYLHLTKLKWKQREAQRNVQTNTFMYTKIQYNYILKRMRQKRSRIERIARCVCVCVCVRVRWTENINANYKYIHHIFTVHGSVS